MSIFLYAIVCHIDIFIYANIPICNRIAYGYIDIWGEGYISSQALATPPNYTAEILRLLHIGFEKYHPRNLRALPV